MLDGGKERYNEAHTENEKKLIEHLFRHSTFISNIFKGKITKDFQELHILKTSNSSWM